MDWAHRQVEERGGYLIIIGRFIPGGRIVVTLSCGMLEMPWRRFIAFDVVAGLVWATYAAMLGYVGGRTFEESPLKGSCSPSPSRWASRSHRGVSLVRRRRAVADG